MTAPYYRGVGYAPADGEPVLDGVELVVEPGEMLLVAGPSGSGKSTLLRCANGLVPHASGGHFRGEVVVAGRSTRTSKPREFASLVGFVHQDPDAHAVVDHVEGDIAFALENLGMEPAAMRRRVEEVLDAVGIAHLRDRAVTSLSGGERQRCAIAGALAAGPGVLALDEPTSQLDPQGAEDVLSAVGRLRDDLGSTVLISEHRLERAAPLADRAVLLDRLPVRALTPGPVADVLASYAGAPAVTRLGRLLGWDPLPLTVRDARRHPAPDLGSPRPIVPAAGDVITRVRDLTVQLRGRRVLGPLSLDVRQGEIVGVLGRNGAGKTTLLRALAGLQAPSAGSLERAGRAGYLPQDPTALLLGPTVRDDLLTTCRLLKRDTADVDVCLERFRIAGLAARHPRTLSVGERQRVALAAIAVGKPEVLLLDEPTRGMDAPAKAALAAALREHASVVGAVVLATHDVELAAEVVSRVVVLGDGEVVADGPARATLAGSLFAPQIGRVMPPFLTVGDVEVARR